MSSRDLRSAAATARRLGRAASLALPSFSGGGAASGSAAAKEASAVQLMLLRQRLAQTMDATGWGAVLILLDVGLSLVSVFIYIAATYGLHPRVIYDIDLALACYFTLNWLFWFWLAEDRLRFVLSFMTLIDAVTIVPSFVLYALERVLGTSLPGLNFLRVLRILRVLKVFSMRSIMARHLEGAVAEAAGKLVFTLLSILFIAAGAFFELEKYGSADREFADSLTFHQSLYWASVTLTTVGYGDFSPTYWATQLMLIALLMMTFTLLPYLTGQLMDALTSSTTYQRDRFNNFSPNSASQHVVFLGAVDGRTMAGLLDELYHEDKGFNRQHSVFLSPAPPSHDVQHLLAAHPSSNKLTYLQGSPFRMEDLSRASAEYASAIFVVAPKHAEDPLLADRHGAMIVLSVGQYLQEARVKLEQQLLSAPHRARHWLAHGTTEAPEELPAMYVQLVLPEGRLRLQQVLQSLQDTSSRTMHGQAAALRHASASHLAGGAPSEAFAAAAAKAFDGAGRGDAPAALSTTGSLGGGGSAASAQAAAGGQVLTGCTFWRVFSASLNVLCLSDLKHSLMAHTLVGGAGVVTLLSNLSATADFGTASLAKGSDVSDWIKDYMIGASHEIYELTTFPAVLVGETFGTAAGFLFDACHAVLLAVERHGARGRGGLRAGRLVVGDLDAAITPDMTGYVVAEDVSAVMLAMSAEQADFDNWQRHRKHTEAKLQRKQQREQREQQQREQQEGEQQQHHVQHQFDPVGAGQAAGPAAGLLPPPLPPTQQPKQQERRRGVFGWHAAAAGAKGQRTFTRDSLQHSSSVTEDVPIAGAARKPRKALVQPRHRQPQARKIRWASSLRYAALDSLFFADEDEDEDDDLDEEEGGGSGGGGGGGGGGADGSVGRSVGRSAGRNALTGAAVPPPGAASVTASMVVAAIAAAGTGGLGGDAAHNGALAAVIHLLRSPSRRLRSYADDFMRQHYHMRTPGAIQSPSDMVMDSLPQQLTGHTLVVGVPHSQESLLLLLAPLRSRRLAAWRPLVIVDSTPPGAGGCWAVLSQFRDTYFVQVTDGLNDALLRANAERAHQAILMSPLSANEGEGEDTRLASKVMTDALVLNSYQLLRGLNPQMQLVTEVMLPQNMAYLAPTSPLHTVPRQLQSLLSPAFISGSVFMARVVDDLMIASYSNNASNRIILQLLQRWHSAGGALAIGRRLLEEERQRQRQRQQQRQQQQAGGVSPHKQWAGAAAPPAVAAAAGDVQQGLADQQPASNGPVAAAPPPPPPPASRGGAAHTLGAPTVLQIPVDCPGIQYGHYFHRLLSQRRLLLLGLNRVVEHDGMTFRAVITNPHYHLELADSDHAFVVANLSFPESFQDAGAAAAAWPPDAIGFNNLDPKPCDLHDLLDLDAAGGDARALAPGGQQGLGASSAGPSRAASVASAASTPHAGAGGALQGSPAGAEPVACAARDETTAAHQQWGQRQHQQPPQPPQQQHLASASSWSALLGRSRAGPPASDTYAPPRSGSSGTAGPGVSATLPGSPPGRRHSVIKVPGITTTMQRSDGGAAGDSQPGL